MTHYSRREFLRKTGGIALLSAWGLPLGATTSTKTKGRVIVIGGGYGGAITAKYIRLADPGIQVTLIERDKHFISCPLSNEILSGEPDIESLTFGYDGLRQHGVQVIHAEARTIDPVKKTVITADQKILPYDKLVVSPGVDFQWDAIENYTPEVADTQMPHAWQAGPQTLLLRQQLVNMADGGLVCITAPPNPFRCPPGPYERAAQIAHYLRRHKPKSKVLILDSKYAFSKKALFTHGWQVHYGDMIEWVPGAEDGRIEEIDPENGVLIGDVDEFKADVANVIPPQKAGAIAFTAGLTDESGWCPINQRTFESSLHQNIYVIGDACIAGEMPKSGYAANSQGKVCAAAIVAELNGMDSPEPSYVNTCYSIIAPGHGISVADVYRFEENQITSVPGAGGLSSLGASKRDQELEVGYAYGWLKNITSDMFG